MTEVAGVQPGSAPLWDSAPRAKAGSASAEISASRAQAGSAPASREEAARIIAENDVAAFPRLRGVPGYQLEPVPWAKAVVLAKEGTEAALGQLGRSPAALVVYHRFKLEVGCGHCQPRPRGGALAVPAGSPAGQHAGGVACRPALRAGFPEHMCSAASGASPCAQANTHLLSCCLLCRCRRSTWALRTTCRSRCLALRLHSPAVRLLAKLVPASCLICIAQWRLSVQESAVIEGLLFMSAQAERCGLFLAAEGRKQVVVPADLGSREPIVVWRPNVRTQP